MPREAIEQARAPTLAAARFISLKIMWLGGGRASRTSIIEIIVSSPVGFVLPDAQRDGAHRLMNHADIHFNAAEGLFSLFIIWTIPTLASSMPRPLARNADRQV